MIKHFILLVLIAFLLTGGMFLPFMPGEYDATAITFSLMVQLAGFTGLLLVVVAVPWLWYEIRKGGETGRRYKGTYRFAMTTLILSPIPALGIAVGAFATDNRFLGFGILILYVCIFVILLKKVRLLKDNQNLPFCPAPAYLVCLPLVIVFVRYMYIEDAISYSRARAISQSEELIHDIEFYYKNNGQYPVSMLSVNKDYKTSVIGVKQYHYELNGESYNIFFEQFAEPFGTVEIVMYNKLDQHEMTSHDQDLLLLSRGSLNQQRGYFKSGNLPQPHWKYFWFD